VCLQSRCKRSAEGGRYENEPIRNADKATNKIEGNTGRPVAIFFKFCSPAFLCFLLRNETRSVISSTGAGNCWPEETNPPSDGEAAPNHASTFHPPQPPDSAAQQKSAEGGDEEVTGAEEISSGRTLRTQQPQVKPIIP
jgi:hypothetical protein